MQSQRPTPEQNGEQTQLRAALRESQLLRELSELLSSSFDTTHILQILVKRTTEVCEVTRCSVWLLDAAKEQLRPAAYHFATHDVQQKIVQLADRTWHRGTLPFHTPLMDRLQQPPGILIVEDLQTEDSMQVLADKFFARSVLLVALMREGHTVGLMSLDNPGKKTTFTSAQQQTARAIGQQAAIAIDNARLYQEAQEERIRSALLVERSQALYAVAQEVNSDDELSRVLAVALHHLSHGLHAQDASLVLFEEGTLVREKVQQPSVQALSELYNSSHTGLTLLPHIRRALQTYTPLFVSADKLQGDERYLMQQLDLRTGLIVPLLLGHSHTQRVRERRHQHTCVGLIFVRYQQETSPPSQDELTFAQEMATHCATAIEKEHMRSNTHRANELATERAHMLDALFNALTEGLLVIDRQGKVLLTNGATAQYFTKKRNIRQQVTFYLRKNPAFTLSGEPIPLEKYPLMRALAGEKVREERYQHRYPDGTQKSFVVNIAPLLDSGNQQIGIVCAFRDITRHVLSEHRLRGALDTLLHAVEAISGITNIDEMLSRILTMLTATLNCDNGAIQLYDAAQQTYNTLCACGSDPQQIETWLIDTPIDRQTIAVSIKHKDSFLGRILLSHTLPQAQYEKQAPTNLSTLSAFSTWDRTVVEGVAQFLGLAIEQVRWQHEVQIARSNEASMRESNELKDEFLAITAHEFRTPLTIILTNSQMMSRQIDKTPDLAPALHHRLDESIASIQEQTRHLTNIVNTFLEVTLFNRGQVELAQEEVNLEEVMQEIINDHRTANISHNILYQAQPPVTRYILRGDRARLKQTITNLLQNAIKYSPQGSRISISLLHACENSNDIIQVIIEDEGIGIPLEAQAHLFERFYRAPSIGNQTHGVGLGLYIVAEIVRLHGGSIRAESSGIMGEGSRFILTLPEIESTYISTHE
jgi:signal transduction histidine kinase/PAS domain-containing protein